MMDAEGSLRIENEQQFWIELDKIVAVRGDTHEAIDDALRSYLAFVTGFKGEYLPTEYDVGRCCYRLLDAELFRANEEYIRRQFLYCLLEEDDVDTLHFAAGVLLYDGRAHESVFEVMQAEGAFPRLVQLIRSRTEDEDSGPHRLLLELLFEMSRIQKLQREDLVTVDDNFILYLFELIERLSDDAEDPYHYPIIRVILVLNEQYMCLANAPAENGQGAVTNRILKILSTHGPMYRTFGENLILLLNREAALSRQLLILKLLYLLFTTPSTYEYFYTNDLHVLVDVIIRNLLDLDPEQNDFPASSIGGDRAGQRALRHTYLRVLCPLLKNTQLAREGNNYKREEVRKLLYLLVNRSTAHFAPVDETVLRLVIRCKQIEWLREEGDEQDAEIERKLAEVAPKNTEVAKKLLGMSLEEAGESSLSVLDVSAKVTKEKPSVPAPRRKRKPKTNGDIAGPPNGSSSSNSQGGGLDVPPVLSLASGSDYASDSGRSPFADDNGDV